MTDFRDIEVKAGNHSMIITVLIGLMSLLILLVSFSFDHVEKPIEPIQIAMNFGSTDLGMGKIEPSPINEPIESPNTSTSTPSETRIVEPTTINTKAVITQNTKENIPIIKNKPTTKQKQKTSTTSTAVPSVPDEQPKTDQKATNALSQLLSGKGNNPATGQGLNQSAGNVGDPKGENSRGNGIGEKWRSTIPEPQKHDCSASGIILVEIYVNANGSIKSAIPGIKGSTTTDPCLNKKAKDLVLKYVRAEPGADARKGVYKVNLK